MSIPAVNYRETFFPKPDLTRIIGIPTYDTLHQMQLELKSNALSVHSNLGGGAHGHLGLLMTNAQYALISDAPYERPEHPGVLHIPHAATRVASDALKRTYDENLRVFHEVRGVEQALIQQIVTAVDEQYITAVKNRETGQFTGDIRQIFTYLLNTYGKISPSQLSEFEKEVTNMHYDPVSPVDNIFNKIEDLLEYGDLANCPFSQPQAIGKAYNLINRTGKFREAIKAWNHLPAVQKTWINFKTHFREAHLELTETGELTIEQAGYGQANMVNEIVERLSTQLYCQGANMMHEEKNDDQPDTAPATDNANHATTDNILQQVLTQNQELMRMLASNAGPRRQNRRPRPSTGPRQGQPRTPMPAHFNKYCWTHGRGNHEGPNCNNKAPGHKDEATMDNKMGGSTYGCN
jgi:uncharacterized phage-associated protein